MPYEGLPLHTLPEGDDQSSYVISGDGRWVIYSCWCPGEFMIRKIATTPGAVPTPVETSYDETWVEIPGSVNHDGTLFAFERDRRDGHWMGTDPAYLYDLVNQREVLLPQARDNAFLDDPILSADGSVVLAEEECIEGPECLPVDVYAVSVPDHLSGS